jgi:hypothetical protein
MRLFVSCRQPACSGRPMRDADGRMIAARAKVNRVVDEHDLN